MDFTRTMPRDEEESWVYQLYNESGEMCYPLPFIPRHAVEGDYLYTLYRGRVIGRNKILSIDSADECIDVGSLGDGFIEARCMVIVECPGELAPFEIFRKGHQGIRYIYSPLW